MCEEAAALRILIHCCVRPKATGLQDWRMGAWMGIPPLPQSWTFVALHPLWVAPRNTYGAFSCVFLAGHPSPKELGLEYRGTKRSRWYLKHTIFLVYCSLQMETLGQWSEALLPGNPEALSLSEGGHTQLMRQVSHGMDSGRD